MLVINMQYIITYCPRFKIRVFVLERNLNLNLIESVSEDFPSYSLTFL